MTQNGPERPGTGLASAELAERAGLIYVENGMPGHTRRRRGRGFSYHDAAGNQLSPEETARVRTIAVPPAWQDVWISPNGRGHILATGTDDAGRKQYIYHPDWDDARDAIKFDLLVDFGERLARLRKTVTADLESAPDERAHAAALAIAILDRTLMRVGNDEYAQTNQSYGLTTLLPDHVRFRRARARFEFEGKGGSLHVVDLEDEDLVERLRVMRRLKGSTLLAYRDDDDTVRSLRSEDINDYLRRHCGQAFTAKIFRTWGATSTVVTRLARRESNHGDAAEEVRGAIESASDRLGNTPEICASAYVHPAIPKAHLDGRVVTEWKRAREGRWVSRGESTVRLLLNGR